jgi:5-methylcytosine-specific restriction enzyme A
MDWYVSQDPEFIKREKSKAREVRASQWWKNQLAKGLCYYCGERFHPRDLTMDHKTPIARGGTSSKANLVVSCKPCNSAKQSKTVLEFSLQKD